MVDVQRVAIVTGASQGIGAGLVAGAGLGAGLDAGGCAGTTVGAGRVGPIAQQLRAGFLARVAAGDDAPRER